VYEASVTLHVLAAIVGFGVTYSYPVLQLLGERGDRRHLAFALETVTVISRYVAVPATVVVGLTGIYQIADGPYGLDDAWLATAIVLYVVVMGVAAGYLAPRYGRAAAAVRSHDAAAYEAERRRIGIVGTLVAAAVLAIATMMVVKP
jgi:uncharacterized membrane protein